MGGTILEFNACTCAEIQGEDPECPLHGMTLERVAAWSDDECMIDPEIDSFTVRWFAQQALAEWAEARQRLDDLIVAAAQQWGSGSQEHSLVRDVSDSMFKTGPRFRDNRP